jgi:hypothetical protein
MKRELPADPSTWTTRDALAAISAGLPLPREVALRLLGKLLELEVRLEVQQEHGYRRMLMPRR